MTIAGPTTNHMEIRHWAERNGAVPVELLPAIVDHIPAELRFVFAKRAERELNLRLLAWEEFFIKFDQLGLTFVYDTEAAGYNELLQREEDSPYRSPVYPVPKSAN